MRPATSTTDAPAAGRIFALLVLISILAACATATGDHGVRSLTNGLCDKNIVLLGELPSHGEAKTFGMKAEIVQDLVAHCGFDAVLFEAPIYDFAGFRDAVVARSAEPKQLDDAIGRFWHTRELQPFRAWLYEQSTTKGLWVGGIDDQVSVTSHYARAKMPQLVPAECAATVRRNLEWTYNDNQPFDDAEKQKLHACTRAGASANVLVRNLASYVDRQIDIPNARTRDAAMYDNLQWHLSQLPKGSKVVVWTATVHAARTQGEIGYRPLGSYVAEAYGEKAAAIAFTAWTGETSMAGRPPKELAVLPVNSLEASALRADAAWVSLDKRELHKRGKMPSRLLGKITAADWGDYFDVVVVIREEAAPVFDF